jgi:RNA polymerase sigma-70 factor (ECF subfamily)
MRTSSTSGADLIRRACGGDGEALGALLERSRPALMAEVARQLRGRIAARVDAADVIQQTFLEAHRGIGGFRGSTDAEFAAWVRAAASRNAAEAIRSHARAARRDVRRERSLDGAPWGSPPTASLDAGHTSPSRRAMRVEDVAMLASALRSLPDDQREAVRLRHLEGWSLDRIAERIGRSHAATAGLIKRGMHTLRHRLGSG